MTDLCTAVAEATREKIATAMLIKFRERLRGQEDGEDVIDVVSVDDMKACLDAAGALAYAPDRAAVLEEAAKECERHARYRVSTNEFEKVREAKCIAEAIRRMK